MVLCIWEDKGVKIIILFEVEDFCKEHNFNMIGLERLRQLARDTKPSGTEVEFKAGYGQCLNDLITFIRSKRP